MFMCRGLLVASSSALLAPVATADFTDFDAYPEMSYGLEEATFDGIRFFEFNTIADNDTDGANDARAGINCGDPFPIRNNIVTGNAMEADCTATHSLFSGAQAPGGTGNMVTTDPMFLAVEIGSIRTPDFYRLGDDSPAIDKADSASAVTVDIDGQARPQGAEKDIGADEVIR